MRASYGYLPGTNGKGADGEAVDIYLAKAPKEGARVFKVRQKRQDGSYDEDKFMLGYSSATEARKDFLRHMPSWTFGSMTTTSMQTLKNLQSAA